MKTKLLGLLIIPILTSCAIHSGSMSSHDISAKTKFVDVAYGTSNANYILGIGGLTQDAIINNAKKQLYVNRPLKAGEHYANFTIDIKHSYYLLVSKQTVTVGADIVKETDKVDDNRFSESFLKTITPDQTEINNNSLFSIGDRVMLTNYKKGVIETLKGSNRVTIRLNNGKLVTKSINAIFNMETTYNGLSTGDMFEDLALSGKVMALGYNKLIIIDKYNELDIVFYKKKK